MIQTNSKSITHYLVYLGLSNQLYTYIFYYVNCIRNLGTLSIWADNLEDMVNESTLPNNIRSTLHEEADRLLDMIGDFGDNLTKKPVEQLSKDLVNIRRRSNRLALDIYLNTFDMRWPQASLQLGVLVERAQQACSLSADRAATLVFNRILQQSIN